MFLPVEKTDAGKLATGFAAGGLKMDDTPLSINGELVAELDCCCCWICTPEFKGKELFKDGE